MQSSAYQLKQEHRHLCRCKEEETEVVSFLPSSSIDLDKRVSHRDLPASSSEIDQSWCGGRVSTSCSFLLHSTNRRLDKRWNGMYVPR